MKLALRLLLAPLLTAAAVLSTAEVNAVLMQSQASDTEARSKARFEQLQTLSAVQTQLGQVHAGLYRGVALIASLDDAKIKALRADAARQVAAIKGTMANAVADSLDDAGMARGAQAAAAEIDRYIKAADDAVDLASVDPGIGVAAMQAADTAFGALDQTVAAMVVRIAQLGDESSAAAQARGERNQLLLALLGLGVAAAAVGGAWRSQRRIVSELARAAAVAQAVAAGDLSADSKSERRDEVGDLLRALDGMASQLAQSMRTVRESSQSIQGASAEIATGNLDLSQRTDEAAARLQQTAGSMSALTDIVRQSSAHASDAHRLAGNAALVAQRGGAAVGQVVATMREINHSSERIAAIIGVIDSIAFQTNILALNAAVEAARAGEQGRGFAVVASEVRSLAQRSAAAAKEIKGLIDTSVERVTAGTRLVHNAGQTMDEIVSSVQHVTDIMSAISASARSQSEGIDSVDVAVSELDQMTQQNAALVEQSAAAAQSLKDQAVRLNALVGKYRVRSSA